MADAVKTTRPADATAPVGHAGSVLKEDRSDPLVGTVINGFKILSRIGSGGFGVVYRAFDTNLQRSVAIKMLPPKIAKSSQGLVERFLREARSAAKLSHPNIVTIHQICQYKDTYYIVMELVDGGALHEFLAVQKRFDPKEATRVIRSAAEGLGHAHRRGIIHRDIKPGNIMMTNDGQVKVSDFGLARDVLQGRDIVGPGHSLGTPRYMAPEQALGGEPTSASDLYSLAATYFALLTGRPPFEGSNDRELMKKHVTEQVPDPRQHVPTLPVSVYRFFEKAMAKEPEDRYQTAEEFVEALDRQDFSDGSTSTPAMQALKNQIGVVGTENRGTHLTEAITSAVRRGSTGRTPPSTRPTLLEQRMANRKQPAWPPWVKWALIAGGAVLLIIAAIVAAYILHLRSTVNKTPDPNVVPTPSPATTPITSGTLPSVIGTQPTVTPTGAVKPPVTRTTGPTVKTTPKTFPKTTGSTTEPDTPEAKAFKSETETAKQERERNAQAALKVAQANEADTTVDRNQVLHFYEESVINLYQGTEAAKEAQKAADRIRKQLDGTPLTP
jgi:eukaryotic-like serine/threonine-protein kinase